MKKFIVSPIGMILIFALSYALVFGLCIGLVNLAEPLAAIYVVIIGVLGWRFINFVTPSMFIWMPIAGWLIYWAIKFVISCLIGMFILPYHLAKFISEVIIESM